MKRDHSLRKLDPPSITTTTTTTTTSTTSTNVTNLSNPFSAMSLSSSSHQQQQLIIPGSPLSPLSPLSPFSFHHRQQQHQQQQNFNNNRNNCFHLFDLLTNYTDLFVQHVLTCLSANDLIQMSYSCKGFYRLILGQFEVNLSGENNENGGENFKNFENVENCSNSGENGMFHYDTRIVSSWLFKQLLINETMRSELELQCRRTSSSSCTVHRRSLQNNGGGGGVDNNNNNNHGHDSANDDDMDNDSRSNFNEIIDNDSDSNNNMNNDNDNDSNNKNSNGNSSNSSSSCCCVGALLSREERELMRHRIEERLIEEYGTMYNINNNDNKNNTNNDNSHTVVIQWLQVYKDMIQIKFDSEYSLLDSARSELLFTNNDRTVKTHYGCHVWESVCSTQPMRHGHVYRWKIIVERFKSTGNTYELVIGASVQNKDLQGFNRDHDIVQMRNKNAGIGLNLGLWQWRVGENHEEIQKPQVLRPGTFETVTPFTVGCQFDYTKDRPVFHVFYEGEKVAEKKVNERYFHEVGGTSAVFYATTSMCRDKTIRIAPWISTDIKGKPNKGTYTHPRFI